MEIITQVIAWTVNNLALILQVIGIFAMIATITPNKADDKIVQFVWDIVNFMAGNIGKAKNDPNK